MISKTLVAISCALLGACSTIGDTIQGPERVIPEYAPESFSCKHLNTPEDKLCTALNATYQNVIPSKTPTTKQLNDFADAGIEYQRMKCERYMTSVLQLDQYNRSASDLVTNLGAVGTGLMSIVNPDALFTKVIGVTTGTIAATDSVYQNDFLFNNEDKAQLEATVLQHLTDYKATLKSQMPPDATFSSVYNAVFEAYDECTWQHIQNLIQAALKAQQTGKFVAPQTTIAPSPGVVTVNLNSAQEKVRLALSKWTDKGALETEMIKLDIDVPTKKGYTIVDDRTNVKAWIKASTTKPENVEELAEDFADGLKPPNP